MNINKLPLLLALCLPLVANAQTTYSLDQCKTLAKENNLKLKRARLEITAAKEQQKEARAKYLPTVTANANYFHSPDYLMQEEFSLSAADQQKLAAIVKGPGLNPAILAALPTSYTLQAIKHGTLASLIAMQPVFVGGRIINANKLATVQTQVKELMLEQSADEVAQTTEVYYNQLLALYEQEKTLDAADKQLENILKDANNAYEAGVSNKNDVLSVKLKQNEMAVNRLKLNNGIALCKMVLAQYIGAESDIDVRTTIDPSVLPACPLLKIDDAQAVATTPEYQLLQKQVEATKLQRRMEVGKQLPKVAIGVGYNYYDMQRGMKNNFGAAFATVSVPISQWWGGSHAIKRKRLAEESAQQQLTDNAQLLKIRIQKNWNDLDDAYKQLLLAKKGIDQSEENLRLNRNFYQAGTITMNDLLDAQQQFQQSHDRYTEAYAALQTKMIEYEQSIGR